MWWHLDRALRHRATQCGRGCPGVTALVLYSLAMPVVVPSTLDEAVAAAALDDTVLLAGGTDLMVEINERLRPTTPDTTVVALGRVPELTTWTIDPTNRRVSLGAGVTWAEIEREPLRSVVPALAEAARTVGSPQIRNAGTVGGNLATCSPAGDGLPVLAAHNAVVHVVGAAGKRSMSIDQFMVGVKRTALEPGELIEAIDLELVDGFQGYSKVGVRNAMVIATASACLVTDATQRSVRVALGSVAPTVIRVPDAEVLIAEAADWNSTAISSAAVAEAGIAAASASRPIDDHRSSAAYRRHAVKVMVERLVRRAFPNEAP